MLHVFLSCIVLFALGAPAWSAEPPGPVAQMMTLTEGVVYRVAQLNDRQLAAEAAPTLTLDKESGRLSGFSGVNRYGGGYTRAGDQLTGGQMMSTLMAGDAAAMAIEQDFLQLMAEPLTISATTSGVEMRNAKGFMRLVPQEK